MSTIKISDLTELTTAAADDLLLITDSDASASKKIQKSNITQENFTTTLKNKLDGVEAGATADQTAQEIATAIDADATAETTLKSALGLGSAAYTDSTDYATAAQGALADTALQSFTETNDLTSAVTWANIPDANVPQSAVTQHQAALSITEGQISDLGGDIVLDSDIGVTVQAYDADTVKYDDVNPSFTDTGAIKVPTGDTSQQPGTPAAGQFRFNSETGQFEGYNGTAWGAIAGGAGGGAGLQDTLMLMGA